MTIIRIVTVVLLIGSGVLGYQLYSGVQEVIDTREMIKNTEDQVILKLKLIRDAESLFQDQMGHYTSNWDSLANFINTARVPIIERREEIKQKAYGGEEIIVHFDTLGYISAKEKIFKRDYSMAASDNGVFEGFKVKVGDQVIRNQKAYTLRASDMVKEPPFQEKGTITSLADVKVGDQIKRGTTLINYSDYIYDPNVDLTKLSEVPGSGKKFNIFVGKIDRGGLMVDVIEVVDPDPINKERKETNELKTRKPLRFGSRIDVATVGNWE